MFNQCCHTCPSIGGGDCATASNCIGSILPTIIEIKEVKRLFPEVSWGCHDVGTNICKGLVYEYPEAEYSKSQPIINPSDFAAHGWGVAITIAKCTQESGEFVNILTEVKNKLLTSSVIPHYAI